MARKIHWHRTLVRGGYTFQTPCGIYYNGFHITRVLADVTCETCIKLLKKAGREIPDPIPDLHLYSQSFKLKHKTNGKVQLVVTTVEKDPDELRPFMDLVLEQGYDYVLPPATEEEVKAKKKVEKKVKKKKQVASRRNTLLTWLF